LDNLKKGSLASRQRCDISHCSGPVKKSMNENEIILIFSTNHLLLQKFLEDRLCLKDALAVLLKIEEGHLHIENDPKKTWNILQQNVTKPTTKMSKCWELCKNIIVYNSPVTTWRRKESSWGEERYHLIVFENWHYVDFLTMTSREIRFYLKISCPVSFFHCYLFPSQYQQYRLCLPSPSCQFSTYFPSLNCLIVYIDTVGDSRVGTCQHRRVEYHALISTLFISA